jgi:hypothetical protein
MKLRLFHERWRTRVSLLAAGCLDGHEREHTLAHLESCDDCRHEHAEVVAMLAALEADPVRAADLPVPIAYLAARVEARVGALTRSRPFRVATLAYALAVAAVVAVVAPPLVARFRGPRPVPPSVASASVTMDEAALRRLERTMAREQAVRYLNDAENVLVTVAAAPRACALHDHVDLSEETRRSRELVERRALLVAVDDDSVASARPVLEDVDHVLRAVSALDPCASPEDFLRVQQEIETRSLLMKVRLMSRELVG